MWKPFSFRPTPRSGDALPAVGKFPCPGCLVHPPVHRLWLLSAIFCGGGEVTAGKRRLVLPRFRSETMGSARGDPLERGVMAMCKQIVRKFNKIDKGK